MYLFYVKRRPTRIWKKDLSYYALPPKWVLTGRKTRVFDMQILVVDSNTLSRQHTVNRVRNAGHQTLEAESAEHALSALANTAVDMVLIDSNLPGISAFDLTRTVRAQFLNWFPILFLSDRAHDDYLAEGIHAGADDYLLKPLSEPLLDAKLSAMERISLMKRELDTANRQLKQLSTIDPLTNLQNRRGLDSCLEREWCRNQREQSELSVLMIDIDQFKHYNDNYGHQQGDSCIRQIANLLSQTLNGSDDLLARYGGEEFMAVLPYTTQEGAQAIAEQMIETVRQAQLSHQYSEVAPYITISIGVSSTRLANEDSDQLIRHADQALYLAKDYGRNRSVNYGEISMLINTASSRPAAVG